MSFHYYQKSGILSSPLGSSWVGYSGHGEGLNNPEMESAKGIGPLPKGVYTIGKAYNHPQLGPCVMNLEPAPENEMFGRSLFRIHGDNSKLNHTASDGCIIMGPAARKIIAASNDKTLIVS